MVSNSEKEIHQQCGCSQTASAQIKYVTMPSLVSATVILRSTDLHNRRVMCIESVPVSVCVLLKTGSYRTNVFGVTERWQPL